MAPQDLKLRRIWRRTYHLIPGRPAIHTVPFLLGRQRYVLLAQNQAPFPCVSINLIVKLSFMLRYQDVGIRLRKKSQYMNFERFKGRTGLSPAVSLSHHPGLARQMAIHHVSTKIYLIWVLEAFIGGRVVWDQSTQETSEPARILINKTYHHRGRPWSFPPILHAPPSHPLPHLHAIMTLLAGRQYIVSAQNSALLRHLRPKENSWSMHLRWNAMWSVDLRSLWMRVNTEVVGSTYHPQTSPSIHSTLSSPLPSPHLGLARRTTTHRRGAKFASNRQKMACMGVEQYEAVVDIVSVEGVGLWDWDLHGQWTLWSVQGACALTTLRVSWPSFDSSNLLGLLAGRRYIVFGQNHVARIPMMVAHCWWEKATLRMEKSRLNRREKSPKLDTRLEWQRVKQNKPNLERVPYKKDLKWG